MRVLVLLIALALLFCAADALAQGLGIGVMAGEPTGLSFKAWMSGNRAVDAAFGWSLSSDGWFYMHSDYLFHSQTFKESVEGGLPVYYGFGARVLLNSGASSRFGLRVPLGLDFFVAGGNIDIFVEIAPVLDFVPETTFDLAGGIGARFYF